MGCCLSCSAESDDAQPPPIPISAPPPPQSSISVEAVVEEEEKVKEVVSQIEIPPEIEEMKNRKDNIVKHLLLKQSLHLPPNNITAAAAAPAQFQRRTTTTSPLKQRPPISRRTHSFSGDLSAVVAADPSPSRSHRHTHNGSIKIVHSSLKLLDNNNNYNHPGDISGRRLQQGSTSTISQSQRSPSMRRRTTTQLSPIKGRIRSSSNKRVEKGGYTKAAKTSRLNGSADTPSVSLECFIFL